MDNVDKELMMLRALLKQLPLSTLQALAFEFELEILKRFMSFEPKPEDDKIPKFSVVKCGETKEE